jgi:hypothetical protein
MDSPKFLTPEEYEVLISKTKNPSHKLQILIMCEAGLRVSEMINLKWSDCDFKRRSLKVRSLKKRNTDKEVFRSVPISDRLYSCFANIVEKVKSEDLKGFIFAGSDGKPISRNSVNMMLRRLQANNPDTPTVHPHLLRHTFATNLRFGGAELEDIRDALGHEKLETSLIYAHPDQSKIRNILNRQTEKKAVGFFEKVKELVGLRPTHSLPVINLTAFDTSFVVGRNDEIKTIEKALQKGLNIILVGGVGVGKSHILEHLNFNKKVLEIDSMKDFKKSLLNLILHLFDGDKESAGALITGSKDKSKWVTKLSTDSLQNLINIICDITERKEYILKIDNLDDLTPSSSKALSLMTDHFQILTTSRSTKMNHTSLMWNFESIEIKPLDRTNSLQLFHRLTASLVFENLEFTRNRIWNTTEGNPKKILELSERFAKEPVLSGEVVEEITDNYLGKRSTEIDMSIILFVFLFGLALTRFIGRNTNDSDLRFIGSATMLVLMFFRYFIRSRKSKVLN